MGYDAKQFAKFRYQHPYRTEIEQYKYPQRIYTKADPIPYLPFETTTATLVDTPEALEAMLTELKATKEIAIDLEHHDSRSYIGIVSLMQISTRDKDWIVDTLKPWRRRLECLNEVFTDPDIVKVCKLGETLCASILMRLRFYMEHSWTLFGSKGILGST